jgi:hypothetical protein
LTPIEIACEQLKFCGFGQEAALTQITCTRVAEMHHAGE